MPSSLSVGMTDSLDSRQKGEYSLCNVGQALRREHGESI